MQNACGKGHNCSVFFGPKIESNMQARQTAGLFHYTTRQYGRSSSARGVGVPVGVDTFGYTQYASNKPSYSLFLDQPAYAYDSRSPGKNRHGRHHRIAWLPIPAEL